MYEATTLFTLVFILAAGYVRYQTTDRKVLPISRGFEYRVSTRCWLEAFGGSLAMVLIIAAAISMMVQ